MTTHNTFLALGWLWRSRELQQQVGQAPCCARVRPRRAAKARAVQGSSCYIMLVTVPDEGSHVAC